MITIVDYHAGNLASVKKAFDHLGYEVTITEDPAAVRQSTHVVVPGVGHFGVTRELEKSGLKAAVQAAMGSGACFLGICVGMQWMFEASTEAPEVRGFGILKGTVEKFPETVKSPHVGWNSIAIDEESALFKGVPPGSFVYFTHSYRAPVSPECVASSEYGGVFSAGVERGGIFGVQFHPEKSGDVGLKILDNFARTSSVKDGGAC